MLAFAFLFRQSCAQLLKRSGQRIVRTSVQTAATAHTFGAVGLPEHIDFKRTRLHTSLTAGTRAFLDGKAIDTDRMKQAVNRAQRAQIAAERAIHNDSQKQQGDEQNHFPHPQRSCCTAQHGLHGKQGYTAEQRSRRTDISAEPRASLPDKVHHKHGLQLDLVIHTGDGGDNMEHQFKRLGIGITGQIDLFQLVRERGLNNV